MDRATAIRAMGLYAPVAVAFALAFGRAREKRLSAALLLGLVWTLPSLLALQVLNQRVGWWQFYAQGGLFRAMPLDLYLGWAVLWGMLPVLVFRKTRTVWVIVTFLCIDLLLMPACIPVVELNRSWSDRNWLWGELVALLVVLIPSQLLARWTLEDTHLTARAALQAVMAGGIFLFLFPEIVFAVRPGPGRNALLSQPGWLRSLELQAVALIAVLGVSAVQEFAQRGGGTPIPYDPPKRLVASGLYRYVSNPMQLSCVLIMTAWGAILRNPWIALGGPMSFLYSAGLAEWDEGQNMLARFGLPWRNYRNHVRAWRPRWSPWQDAERPVPKLYIAEICGPCSEVRRWFEAQGAAALDIVAAEDHPTHDLQRMTYDPLDGSLPDTGIRAFARGLEHIHLGWAFAGAVMRLPGISHLVQLLLDASGMGPQTIPRRCAIEGKLPIIAKEPGQ